MFLVDGTTSQPGLGKQERSQEKSGMIPVDLRQV